MTVNDASNGLGQFSSGGGPGAGVLAPLASTSLPPSGTRTLTVISRPASLFSAVITPGPRQFGGTMGILGGFSVQWTATSTGFPSGNLKIISPEPFPNPGVPSTQAGTGSATGKLVLSHTVQNFTVPSWLSVWGKNWTTGSATAIALTGSAQTSSTAMGFDVITAMGHRNIQMVTPALTAYTVSIGNAVEGGNNVLNLTFAPETGGSAMLGFGVAALGLIHWVRRRKDH
jgi:hypothetical protein